MDISGEDEAGSEDEDGGYATLESERHVDIDEAAEDDEAIAAEGDDTVETAAAAANEAAEAAETAENGEQSAAKKLKSKNTKTWICGQF